MPNLVEVHYGRTGKSTDTDALGMREMQARAFAARDAQYLLVKAPPASGKSRALMFLAPLPVIEEAIELIISGKIVDYVYDEELKLISRK